MRAMLAPVRNGSLSVTPLQREAEAADATADHGHVHRQPTGT